ncbi:hypothetical protein AWM75_07935 [Aerococcus urinaehominis]|uniref:Uncharacterized protein n=1 Tax=Aerococcus urinaehominis TaxID=128944 RepID=A0A0X8FM76_9LACT|nr:hypothetical protein [Aerococcus urinaehominis]AMB99902.1 hypothetical protein AWM75_07935 [Aerococcus urinaehominis]SDM52428.1 hypothetical protein SAMN04487985_12111 [Aerococcus urinaehominis]
MAIDYEILKQTANKLGLKISFGDKPGFYTPDKYYDFVSLMFEDDHDNQDGNINATHSEPEE